MNAQRIISVSAAPYDGYEFPQVLESLNRIGATHVEPAFIVGYTEPFDESAFTPGKARQWAAWLQGAGIGCDAFSSHIDLGRPDAVEVFRGRMDFARALGARVINTNAAHRKWQARFFENIEVLARHGEDIGLAIGLENPGDGSDNLLNVAADGPALLERIGHPGVVGLNYDAGNTISHRPGVPTAQDALAAMPLCVHTHVKDVRVGDGYFFTPLGDGQVGCDRIVQAIAATALNLSIEIPMRLHRQADAQPSRAPYRVPVGDIEHTLGRALAYVQRHLKAATA